MNKEEVTLLGFEIVAYAGDARSKLLDALKLAQQGQVEQAEALIEKADEYINKAHKAQADLLAQEASGQEIPYSVTMMHGQDHLMTTILLKDVMRHFMELYKRR